MKTRFYAFLVTLFVGLFSTSARALPLDNNELELFGRYLVRERSCLELSAFKRAACRSAAYAELNIQAPKAIWEKDGVSGLTEVDLQLAFAETWDEGALQHICYGDAPQNRVVKFIENCGSNQCAASRETACQASCADDNTSACISKCKASDCADQDKDGIFAYQERAFALDDNRSDTCTASADCGFKAQCAYLSGPTAYKARPVCQRRSECPRPQSGSSESTGCTAFHLESVSQDADEVIVRVHFDYAPVPATVLDLYLDFDARALALVDARPLPTLTAEGHSLEARQPAEGRLRLVVLGTASKRPIDTGAIAELVFMRKTGGQARIAFSSSQTRRELSIAPKPWLEPAATAGATPPPPTAAQLELRSDATWGAPVMIAASSEDSGRLLLHYSFDSSERPNTLNLAKRGADLCSEQSCLTQLDATPPPRTEASRARLGSRIDGLQAGVVETSALVQGVVGNGAFFDGYGNHVELPVTFNAARADQDFSFSTWFRAERDLRHVGASQVLFTHHSMGERSQYSVLITPEPSGSTYALEWLEGELQSPRVRRAIATGLSYENVGQGAARPVWRHFAMALHASARSGHAGEVSFLINGAGCAPGEQRLKITTSLSAAFDLWGTREQSACMKVSDPANSWSLALRKKNGSLAQISARASLPAETGAVHTVHIQVTDGDTNTTSSGAEAATASLGDRSSVTVELVPDSTDPVDIPLVQPPACPAFVEGSTPAQDILKLHELGAGGGRVPEAILFSESQRNLFGIERVDLSGLSRQTLVRLEASSARDPHFHAGLRKLVFASDESGESEIWLANADGTERIQITRGFGDKSRGMFARNPRWAPDGSAILFESNAFDLQANDNLEARAVRLYYIAFDADLGRVAVPVPGNSPLSQLDYTQFVGMGLIDRYRLKPMDRESVSNSYTDARFIRGKDDARGDLGEILFTEVNPRTRLTRVRRLTLPSVFAQATPEELPTVGAVASPRPSEKVLALAPSRALLQRNAGDPLAAPGLYLREGGFDANQTFREVNVVFPDLDVVLSADFSPDGKRLVLSGIMQSRPVVVRSEEIPDSPGGSTLSLTVNVLSEQPVKVDGVQWIKLEQLFACNWLGAQRVKATGTYSGAFRGSLDEFKLYNYVRASEAFTSEAERGLERLARQESPAHQGVAPCGSDLDCPAYHLCEKQDNNATGLCAVTPCSDSIPCARGKCTLMPLPAGGAAAQRVCSVECEADAQCSTQQCLNGPCRYCDPGTKSCAECRTVVQGGASAPRTEGCPDRNAFSCEAGSCVTACYSFDDDQSTYLCQAGYEYCERGACKSFEWSWNDFSPMTFGGLGEMALTSLPRTIAISQLYPVEIVAFGMEDYGVSPELIVEVQRGQDENATWLELGRIQVHHRQPEPARRAPYVLHSPYPFLTIRVRMLTDAYESGAHSATAAPGSLAFLGHPATVPYQRVISDCQGKAGCPVLSTDPLMANLTPGVPAVVIERLDVKGSSVLNSVDANLVCPSRGSLLDSTARLTNRAAAQSGVAFGLLNCAKGGGGELAVLSAGTETLFPTLDGPRKTGAITELGNSCFVEIDPTRTEPCYEWAEGDVSLDPYGGPSHPNRTLDYDTFRSFGFDNNETLPGASP